jgi:ATP-dependent Clp protease protease subunit
MSLKKLVQIQNFAAGEELDPRPNETADARFNAALRIAADASSDATVLDIFGPIGKNIFTGEGVDSQSVSDMLKTASATASKAVTVNLNSPGGSFFQGTAIYNLLAQHPGKVTVNVLGLAGSAASIIAMAGDEILMAPASFIMIHNAAAGADGDRHDLQSVVDTLTAIDYAIRDLYVTRTGKQANKISAMMDDETWMNAKDAIANKFADGMIARAVTEDAAVKNMANPLVTSRTIEAALKGAGMSRSRRRELMAEFKNGPGGIDTRQNSGDSGASLILADLRDLAKDSTPRAAETDATKPRAGLTETLDRLADHLPG